MRRLHPDVLLDENVLFVDDGDVLTSAGLAAGIDLCLHIIRTDHGAHVANAVAKYCVVPPWREGGQAQFIDRQVLVPDQSSTAATREWALQHSRRGAHGAAAGPPRKDEPAHLQPAVPRGDRSVTRSLGAQPRIDRARELLESRDLPIDEVARLSGLGSGGNLRHHLRRGVGMSPSSYRKVYQGV